MNYQYIAYGINISSEIELPSLIKSTFLLSQDSIFVRIGKTSHIKLKQELLASKTFAQYSHNEYLLRLPEIANFYISDGKNIIIEPICSDWNLIYLHFYANALTIALYQRNNLLLHVSGVTVRSNKVVLLAAPRGTGKSSTAVQLHSKGYPLFSDDTVRIELENDKIFAYPSYPMVRMWEDSFINQSIFIEEDKISLVDGVNKFGFHFHDSFNFSKIEIDSIVFLEAKGLDFSIEKINNLEYFKYLDLNFYRNNWINTFKKQPMKFKIIDYFIKNIPAWKATRPLKGNTIKEFSDKIIESVLN